MLNGKQAGEERRESALAAWPRLVVMWLEEEEEEQTTRKKVSRWQGGVWWEGEGGVR